MIDNALLVPASGSDLAPVVPASGSDLYYPDEVSTLDEVELYPVDPVPVTEVHPLRAMPAVTVTPSDADVESVHDFFTTDFSEYTVTEGLLLCVVLLLLFHKLISIIKGGFSWLR